MNISIQSKGGTPIYEQIATQIKEAILAGKLNKDDALPSIRALSADIKVSVITTKNEYDEMEKEKMIMRKLKEREAGITLTLIKKQIVSALKYVSPENAQRCIIAYEPIWAIGTGRVATTQQAQEVCCSIRGIIRDIYGTQIADAIRILYGGSVNAGNALQLFSEPDIDGGLVGGASLKPEFSKIVNYQ